MGVREKIVNLQREINDLSTNYNRYCDDMRLEGMKVVEDKLGPVIVNLQRANFDLTRQIKGLQDINQNQQNQINTLVRERDSVKQLSGQNQKDIGKLKAMLKQEVDLVFREKNKQIESLIYSIQYRLTSSYSGRKNLASEVLRQIDIDLRTQVRRSDDAMSNALNRLKNISYLI